MLTTKIYAQARETPDKTAIVYKNRQLSYRFFARLIDISRRYLARQGFAGAGVAVLPGDNIVDAWVLGLALHSLGLTTLAVGSRDEIGSLGLPEIRYVVTVAETPWPGLAAACAGFGWRFVHVPREIYAFAAKAAAPDMPEMPGPFGGHILLTSGTTGAYKKVLVDPAVEAVLLHGRQNLLGICDQSVVNVSNFGIWTGAGYRIPASTWDAGGGVIYQWPNIYQSFCEPGITHAVVTPQMLAEILRAPADALRRSDTMRLIVTGGRLPQAMAEAARARLSSDIFNLIGSTEAAYMAMTPIERPEDLHWHRVAPSREVQVVDEEGRVLPAGQVGLLRVRLPEGVTGYLHDEAATRAFFRDGYFYPGDLGVFRPDGRLALHGRVTDVINVLGSKIATGPAEEALQDKLEVGGVCVFSLQNEAAEEEIHVAIETARPIGRSRLAAALGSALRGTPIARVHFVDALPRNDMGKIRRDVLKRSLLAPSAESRRRRKAAMMPKHIV
jgi:acyl-coenzyme A synthetase/AMP-(fatty) acid ligase